MKFLSRKFAATTLISLASVAALSGCSTEVMAKAIDVSRCTEVGGYYSIKSDLPYSTEKYDGSDNWDPSSVLMTIKGGFVSPESAEEKGATDSAYLDLEAAVNKAADDHSANIGKFSSLQDYYDAQTIVANQFLKSVAQFGKACEKAGAGDDFKKGASS